MSLPNAYKNLKDTPKGSVIENRDGVAVAFYGGASFEIAVEGVEEVENKRGAMAAFKRAEAIRKELNPDYSGPPAEDNKGDGDDKGPEGSEPPVTEAKATKPKTDANKAEKPNDDREIQIGHLTGVQRMIPVNVLEGLLVNQATRIALLRGSDDVRRLQKRVSATDGRCAPVFLTKVSMDDKEEEPKLFDGLLTIAAALNLDMKKVAVVILPSNDIHLVQSQIAAMPRANMSAPEVAEGDELFYRAGR